MHCHLFGAKSLLLHFIVSLLASTNMNANAMSITGPPTTAPSETSTGKSDLVLRHYQPSDHSAVCALFRDGMRSIYPAYFFSTLAAPKIGLPIAFTSVLVTSATRLLTRKLSAALTAALLSTTLPLLAIWWKIRAGFDKYIEYSTQKDDLSSPEKLQSVYGGKGTFIVAIMGDKLVGMIAGEHKPTKEGSGTFELRRMSVDASVQRSGVARTLVQRLEEELGTDKKKIFLTVTSAQHAARNLYATMGFTCLKDFRFGSWFTQQGVFFSRFEKEY